jgi:hypothetical protein
MALNYSTNPTFSGRITPADVNYPYGSSIDESAPGADDGTPYIKQRADDVLGFQQALLTEADIIPSGSSDTAIDSQYLRASKILFKTGRKNLLNNGEFRLWQYGTGISCPNGVVTNIANNFIMFSSGGSTQVDRVINTTFPTRSDDIKYGCQVAPGPGVTDSVLSNRISSVDSYKLSGKSVTFSFVVNSNEAINLSVRYTTPAVSDDWGSALTQHDVQLIPISIGDNEVEVTFNNVVGDVVNGVAFDIAPDSFTPGSLLISYALTQVEIGSVRTGYDYKTLGDERQEMGGIGDFNYSELPNGLIMQWDEIDVSQGTQVAVSFPIAFPNGFLNITFSVHQIAVRPTPNGISIVKDSATISGFNVRNTDGVQGGTIQYLAIGY